MAERLVWFLLVDQEGVAYKGTSASKVKLPADCDVDDFRDAVKAKNPTKLSHCDASDLVVYANKAAFDTNTADDPTNLEPEDDIGVYGAKTAKMYVVVPEDAARGIDAATTQLTTEQLEMSLNKVLEERDRKRSVYSISTCPRSKEELLKQHLGLEYSSVRVAQVRDNSIPAFQWSIRAENNAEQRTAYMEYLEEHLHDAFMSGKEQMDFLEDVSGKRGLLNFDNHSILPFKVKGTADVMIIDQQAEEMGEVFAGLRFVIEVKKDMPGDRERWQLLLEMVVADVKSEGRCAPVGLLTNLNDYWYFLWFTADRKIARMVLKCPANGFKVMREILKQRSGPSSDGVFAMRIGLNVLDSCVPPLKRQKLIRGASGRDDAAAEMLERYELMSDELSPEFLQQERMRYAFDLVRRMPVHSAMYT